ncbi:MAG: stealth conserved region 3 domain-containing protein [Alphaproteobacteria bacterium]|jgi:hypothetical protein|nr:stealth conserved region 3 domain-containing protein [Alphaproteobacteria bacterium]
MAAPIDVVYTWVDDGFPGYLELRNRYAETPHDLNPNRTRDNLELLRFSLRSLVRHASWVRRVYLVTCRPQVPGWLDPSAAGLTVVHHDQIMDAALLPTFNSFAILSHLHRIEGLSERFLYFEDDMLLGNRVDPSDFVDAEGLIKVYPRAEWTAAPSERDSATTSPWNAALAHSNHLLDAAFGPARRRTVNHVPLLVDKAAWRAMQARWTEDLAHTAASRFRAKYNVAPEFLYLYYLLGAGQARLQSFRRTYTTCFYHGLENSRLFALYGRAMIRLLRPKLIALNDNFDATPNPAVVAAMRRFLEARYPEKSPFER